MYLDDPRESAMGYNQIWEEDNRVEQRWHWGAAILDLCDMDPEEYGTTIFHTDGSATKKYTIKFYSESTLLQSSKVEEGSPIVYSGPNPTKESTEQYVYTFTGWTPELVEGALASKDETYMAQYSSEERQYALTITYLTADESGKYPVETSYTFTDAVAYSDINSKVNEFMAASASSIVDVESGKYTVLSGETTFEGDSASYSATYNEEKKTYGITITGIEEDKCVVTVSGMPYDASLKFDYDAIVDIVFSAKSEDLHIEGQGDDVHVSGTTIKIGVENTVASPVFVADRLYSIRFINGEDVLQENSMKYGVMPEYTGATPTSASSAVFDYVFSAWNPTIVTVVNDQDYFATYNSIKRSYTIKYENNGEVLQESLVEYGETPIYTGATPTKEATSAQTFTFAGWEPAETSVTGEATYNAKFEAHDITYDIKFINYDNTLLKESNVKIGEMPVYEGTPVRPETQEYTYTFNGWDPELVVATEDKTYKATYVETKKSYLAEFWNEVLLQSGMTEYGITPEYTGATPTKEATSAQTFTFAGWNPEREQITANTRYDATFNAETRKYIIQFLGDNSELLQSGMTNVGEIPVYTGATPTKQPSAEWNYDFKEWEPEIIAVTEDKNYQALFSASTRVKYELTYTLTKPGSTTPITGTINVANGSSIADALSGQTVEGYNMEFYTDEAMTIPASENMPTNNYNIYVKYVEIVSSKYLYYGGLSLTEI